jgi:hypothetical protein
MEDVFISKRALKFLKKRKKVEDIRKHFKVDFNEPVTGKVLEFWGIDDYGYVNPDGTVSTCGDYVTPVFVPLEKSMSFYKKTDLESIADSFTIHKYKDLVSYSCLYPGTWCEECFLKTTCHNLKNNPEIKNKFKSKVKDSVVKENL